MRGSAAEGLAREWSVDVTGPNGEVEVLHLRDVGVAVHSSFALKSIGSCVSSSGCIGSGEDFELKCNNSGH